MSRAGGGKRFVVILVGCIVAASAVYALSVTLRPTQGLISARIDDNKKVKPTGKELALVPPARTPTKQIWGRLDVFEEASAAELEEPTSRSRLQISRRSWFP
jgi:hypothetical protein